MMLARQEGRKAGKQERKAGRQQGFDGLPPSRLVSSHLAAFLPLLAAFLPLLAAFLPFCLPALP
jgi:hypothetical protein